MTMTRDELVTCGVERFFKGMNARDLDMVMSHMHDDVEMRIPSSNFTYTGKEALREHLQDFLDNFPVVNFHNFVSSADVEDRRLAVRFDIWITDHEGEQTKMQNCNWFEVTEDRKLIDILIFASAPLSKGFEVGSST